MGRARGGNEAMGMLFRALAPKSLKQARRVTHPVSLLTPKPVRKAKMAAVNVTHPVGAVKRAAEREIVKTVRGSGHAHNSAATGRATPSIPSFARATPPTGTAAATFGGADGVTLQQSLNMLAEEVPMFAEWQVEFELLLEQKERETTDIGRLRAAVPARSILLLQISLAAKHRDEIAAKGLNIMPWVDHAREQLRRLVSFTESLSDSLSSSETVALEAEMNTNFAEIQDRVIVGARQRVVELERHLAELQPLRDNAGAQVAPTRHLQPLTDSPAVPKTDEEQRDLLATRPDAWESRLFAGVLSQEIGQTDLKYEMRPNRGAGQQLDTEAAVAQLSRAMEDMEAIIEPITRVLKPEVQELAFGADGEDGNPVRIKEVARSIAGVYEGLTDWAETLRSQEVPAGMTEVFERAALMANQPLSEIRDFAELTVVETARGVEHLANPDSAQAPWVPVDVKLFLTIDAGVKVAVTEELRRLRKSLAADS